MKSQMGVSSDFGNYITYAMQKLWEFTVLSDGDHEGLSCFAEKVPSHKA